MAVNLEMRRSATATVCRRRGLHLTAVAIVVAAMCCQAAESLGQTPPRDPRLNVNVMLVKNALTAVNHANLTGNYTVLRDLGSPSFRDRNSASQLADVFERIREQKTDLSPILVLDPQFTEPPTVNDAGQLQMAGFFPSQPLQVHFRVIFQMVGGGWAIDTLAVGTPAVKPPGPPIGAAPVPAGAPGSTPSSAPAIAQLPRGAAR